MTVVNIQDVEDELVVTLRNGNVLSASERGIVNSSGGQAANGTDTTFFLGVTGSALRNIRGIWVSGTGNLKFGTDYTVNYYTGSIIFTSAPPSGTSGIWRADYDYGPNEKIYGDYPRLDLGLSSYPRVSCCFSRYSSAPLGIGATHLVSEGIVDVGAFTQTTSGLDDILSKARAVFAVSGTKLHYISYIHPANTSMVGVEPGRHQKIVQREQSFSIVKKVEQI